MGVLTTRTILAIEIDPKRDEYWYVGPPYVEPEKVFDEVTIGSCYRSEKEAVLEAMADDIHPGYPGEVMKIFVDYLSESLSYPHDRLLQIDRVDENGEIYHPYAAKKVYDEWQIQAYLPFTQAFADFSEIAFIKMRAATEQDFRKRKKVFE